MREINVSADLGHDGEVPPLDAFRGNWVVVRDIRDWLAGERLRFEGQASFEPDASGLRYTETGTLLLPTGGALTAQRSYAFRDGVNGIEVFFQDGRPFHAIPRGADVAAATHWCDPDTYAVSYEFVAWPDWTARWDVRGPYKNYSMVTRYSRS